MEEVKATKTLVIKAYDEVYKYEGSLKGLVYFFYKRIHLIKNAG